MKIINKARPFNAGDTINACAGERRKRRLTVVSWRPGVDVNTHDQRGRHVLVGWHEAETGLVRQ
jgi:predicted signal transduction protein with EAL and GGDEF domain